MTSSSLSCNPVGRRGDDGPTQPQTATCCTALQRGFAPDGLIPPRYAPVRTPASAALLLLHHDDDDDDGDHPATAEPSENDDTTTAQKKKKKKKKVVRKCKSTVDDQLSIQPRQLRRSGAVRRDWSFEDLHSNKAA